MGRPLARAGIVAAVTAASFMLLPAPGGADVPIPIPTLEPSSSPSPTASPRTSPKPKATSSPRRSTRPQEPRRATQPRREEPRPTPERSLDPIVEEGLKIWEEREKTPSRTTTGLLDLIAQSVPRGVEPTFEQQRAAFGRFPVVGYVWYQDDWAAPRYIPYFHLHEGTDLFAKSGTPVIACVDGTIWKLARGGSGGNAVWLLGDDGVRYYYGHLKRVRRGLEVGDRVAVGDPIGTVGATGNAKGTYPHVHFEVNPGGLGTINPKPVLDSWLTDAEHSLRAQLGLLPPVRAGSDRGGAARWPMLTDLLARQGAFQPALWTAAMDASSTIAYADLALASLSAWVDWGARAAVPQVAAAPNARYGRDIAALLLADAEALRAPHVHEIAD